MSLLILCSKCFVNKNLFFFGTNNALNSLSGKAFRELLIANKRVRLKTSKILKMSR